MHTTEPFTIEARLSFLQLNEPKANDQGNLMYSCVLLVPKTSNIDKIKAAIADVIRTDFNGVPEAAIKAMSKGIKDGDIPNGAGKIHDGFAGNYVINVSSKFKPRLIDENVNDVLTKDKFYAGCWAKAQIHAYGFKNPKKQGISFGVSIIQFIKNGDRLGGVSTDPIAAGFTAVPGSAAAAAAPGATGDSIDDFL